MDLPWASELYAQYPQVLGAGIWYLGSGFGDVGVDHLFAGLMAELGSLAEAEHARMGALIAELGSQFIPVISRKL